MATHPADLIWPPIEISKEQKKCLFENQLTRALKNKLYCAEKTRAAALAAADAMGIVYRG